MIRTVTPGLIAAATLAACVGDKSSPTLSGYSWTSNITEVAITDPKAKLLRVRIQGHQPDGQTEHGCLAFDDVVVIEK